MTDRRLWSFEYVDEEGDLVTTNFIATADDVKQLLDKMIRRGMRATAYDLSPPAVISPDDKLPRLE